MRLLGYHSISMFDHSQLITHNFLLNPEIFACIQLAGWLVGFWCTHFRDLAPLIIHSRDLAPLINSVLVLVSSAKVT